MFTAETDSGRIVLAYFCGSELSVMSSDEHSVSSADRNRLHINNDLSVSNSDDYQRTIK